MLYNDKKTIVINLFGGPGTGKSTTAAALFAELKYAGYEAEIVTEFAKDLTWEDRKETFKDQLYLFAKQNHRIFRCNGKVDFIVTDCPLLLSAVYNEQLSQDNQKSKDLFTKFVIDTINHYTNLNIFLNRVKPYHANGRSQNEEQAKELDVMIKQFLINSNQTFTTFDAIQKTLPNITKFCINQFQKSE